jgi:hypothetical protein
MFNAWEITASATSDQMGGRLMLHSVMPYYPSCSPLIRSTTHACRLVLRLFFFP